MTRFSVTLQVNEEKYKWLRDEYNSLFFLRSITPKFSFDFDHHEAYTQNYEENDYDYENGRRKELVEEIDDSIYDQIDEYLEENFDDEEDLELEKKKLINDLDRTIQIRNLYIEKIEKYKKFYEKKMEIFIDSFPNFEMVESLNETLIFSNIEDQNEDNYEYVRNPFFLALFLQNYMTHFSIYTPIVLKYFENSDNGNKLGGDAGAIIIDMFEIKHINLDDLEKSAKNGNLS